MMFTARSLLRMSFSNATVGLITQSCNNTRVYRRRRRSMVAPVLRSLWHDVCVWVGGCVGMWVAIYVGVYVSTIKRKPLVAVTWNLAH